MSCEQGKPNSDALQFLKKPAKIGTVETFLKHIFQNYSSTKPTVHKYTYIGTMTHKEGSTRLPIHLADFETKPDILGSTSLDIVPFTGETQPYLFNAKVGSYT